jgi:hypothetical protein
MLQIFFATKGEKKKIYKIRRRPKLDFRETALHFSFKRQGQLNKTLKQDASETDISFSE